MQASNNKPDIFSSQLSIAMGYIDKALSELMFANLIASRPTATWSLHTEIKK